MSTSAARYSRWQPPVQANPSARDAEYDVTVDQIASRGFTLGALLELLCVLLERTVMPSFDPDTSTTEEVTYCAVIPSSEGGPYARVMTCGQPCYPKCLITHTWGNVFSHTVAAAVADAMEIPYFFHLVPRLRTAKRVRRLMEEIARLGGNRLVMKTYWLCALSVNQHRVGCHAQHLCGKGHLLKHCGSVTNALQTCTNAACHRAFDIGDAHFDCRVCGEVFCTSCKLSATRVCSCDTEKLLTGSDSCEVDKFDQMMVRLQGIHKDFYQVVALDKAGNALTRTWVVAEIAQAQRDGLAQNIQTFFPLKFSRRGIKANILNIDVRKSQATNPADTAKILAKIGDKDRYNEGVRRALLQSIRPSRLGVCKMLGVLFFGAVFATTVFRATFITPGDWCPHHDCQVRAFFMILTVLAMLLIVSQIEYGAIGGNIRACRGLRYAALREAESASSTTWKKVLWPLQRWYVRQSAERDVVDDELLPRETDTETSTFGRLHDYSLLMVLRAFILAWCGSSFGVTEDAFEEANYELLLDPLCTFFIAAIILSYDPALQEPSAEGAVLLALLVAVCPLKIAWEYSGALAWVLIPVVALLSCALCALFPRRHCPCPPGQSCPGQPAGRGGAGAPGARPDTEELV